MGGRLIIRPVEASSDWLDNALERQRDDCIIIMHHMHCRVCGKQLLMQSEEINLVNRNVKW